MDNRFSKNSTTKKLIATVALIFSLSPIVMLFQNCGEGFKSGYEANFSTLASTAPTIQILAPPAVIVNGRDISFSFKVEATSVSSVTKILCAIDGALPSECQSPLSLTGLQDGAHVVAISAEDNRGNKSAEVLVRFQVDATLPQVVINSAPAIISGAATATFIFTASDNLSGVAAVECSFDNAAFALCVSPRVFNNLAQVAHTFRVRARDVAGNVSNLAQHNWSVDLTAPVVTIVTGPNNVTNLTAATFTFTGTDDGLALNNFQCSLDGAAAVACTNPQAYNNLAEGNHTFSLRALDTANNLSAAVARAWMVDLTAPIFTIVAAPTGFTNQTNVAILFTAADAGSGVDKVECSLDNGAFAVCVSPQPYNNLANGTHTFSARALDKAGNTSATFTRTWGVDNVPPTVTFTTAPPEVTGTSASFSFIASDAASGVDKTECSLDNGAFAVCTSPKTYNDLPVGNRTFRVRAADVAGNLSAVLTHAWTATAKPPPPPQSWDAQHTKLVMNDQFGVCALGTSGKVQCIGSGEGMGDGVGYPRQYPADVKGLNDAVDLAASKFFFCAVRQNGQVVCWGNLDHSGLGLRSEPFAIPGITTAVKVYGGNMNGCAIEAAGTVQCWGWNGFGVVSGTGTNDNIMGAARVPGITSAVDMFVSSNAACAVLADGTVSCWGQHILESGTNLAPVYRLSTLTNVKRIWPTFCVRLGTGEVQCPAAGATYAPVPEFANAKDMSGNNCAIIGTQVKCWSNRWRAFLSETSRYDLYDLQPANVGTDAADLIAGETTYLLGSCLINTANQLKCWGWMSSAGIGNGLSLLAQTTPKTLTALGLVKNISAAMNTTCAATIDGQFKCSGFSNVIWQTTEDYNTGAPLPPVGSLFSTAPGVNDAQFAAADTQTSCYIKSDNSLKCFNDLYQATGLQNVLQLDNSCARLADGTVKCWGGMLAGLLGVGGGVLSAGPPTLIPGISTAKVLAAHREEFGACVILQDGTVSCWGIDPKNLVSRTEALPKPTVIAGLTNVASISYQWVNMCAALIDGTVKCVGNNQNGQIPGAPVALEIAQMTQVAGVSNVAKVAVGANFICALLKDSQVMCWGDNSFGIAGDGTMSDPILPRVVPGLTGVADLSVGQTHVCVKLATGEAKCWGLDIGGELGQRNPKTPERVF